MTKESKSQAITEDEAALYDRQIRLWGLDAQKRLRAASVLLCGVCGLGAEVTKNLVLAGIKSITLLDHQTVTEVDAVANFLAPSDSIGKNIAEASQERAQTLNPMVTVLVDSDNLKDKPDAFFAAFDVVVIARCSSQDLLVHINDLCRRRNTLFYAGAVHGMFGYMFVDLNEHNYVEEIKESTEVVVNGEKTKVEETKMVKKTEPFVPLRSALDVDWTSATYCKRLRRTNVGYFIMQVLLEFHATHQRLPSHTSRDEDIHALLSIKHAMFEKMAVPQEKLGDDFPQMLFGQLSPVCAIVGGEIGAEVIKAVSGRDPPHNNFFFYSPLEEGSGSVHNIGI